MKKQCSGRCVEITVSKGEITDNAFLGYLSEGRIGLCVCSVRDDAKHSVISFVSPNNGFFASRSLNLTNEQFRVLCRQLSFVMGEMDSAGFDCRGMMLEKDCVFFDGTDFIFIVLPMTVIKPGKMGKELSAFLSSCCSDKKNIKIFSKALKECKTARECIQKLNEFANSAEISNGIPVGSGFINTSGGGFGGFPAQGGSADTVLLTNDETEADGVHSDFYSGDTTVLSRQGTDSGLQQEFYSGDTTVLSRQGTDDNSQQEFYSGDTTLLDNSNAESSYAGTEAVTPQPVASTPSTADSGRVMSNYTAERPARRSIYLIRANTGDVYEINSDLFTIGSDAQRVTCVIDNPSVSHVHASIMYRNGNYHLADNDSTNGTSLDGVTLGRGESRELYDGAIISFGTEPFQISYGG